MALLVITLPSEPSSGPLEGLGAPGALQRLPLEAVVVPASSPVLLEDLDRPVQGLLDQTPQGAAQEEEEGADSALETTPLREDQEEIGGPSGGPNRVAWEAWRQGATDLLDRRRLWVWHRVRPEAVVVRRITRVRVEMGQTGSITAQPAAAVARPPTATRPVTAPRAHKELS
jgi:hypothetical protein